MKIYAAACTAAFCSSALALDLGDFVGYTIVASKTIEKWIDPDDGKSGTSFEGCTYGRIIVFDDGTGLICATYSYSYSYRPTAILLSNGNRIVMVVDQTKYDMNRLR